MKYKIRILKNGECRVRNYITYTDGNDDTSLFYLYVYVIEGGEKPMLVDTGPRDVEVFNKGTGKYIPGGVIQKPEERTPELLKQAGVEVNDVSHVFITHLHGDHYDYFDLFPNAQFVVNKRGFTESLMGIKPNVMRVLARRWPQSLKLVEDEEVMPGIRTFWLGCHSVCSQAVAVDTTQGTVVFTGDVVYKYKNMENNIPIGWAEPEPCLEAMKKIRKVADIVIPSHDPEILERFPEGIIGDVSG
ncbi:MBL fold metallo-hydrolase [Candidatus Poribacteria bacterium]|nr:MBL fold metallo-hydrolase [Candidatus Poribacteria bacterium]